MNDPRPGWNLQRALDLLGDGYTAERVSRLSGFAVPYLEAQLRAEAAAEKTAR